MRIAEPVSGLFVAPGPASKMGINKISMELGSKSYHYHCWLKPT
jgi:hypothetical protein